MKKKIVLAIAIGLCTATLGNSFAKGNTSSVTPPQDTSSVRRHLPPMSPPPQDSTDTPSKVTPASPQTPSNNHQTDSAKVD